jgi:hypothetical protein
MSYTSKYAQDEMNRAVSGKDKDPKKRLKTNSSKMSMKNEKVEKKRQKDEKNLRETGDKEKYMKKSQKKSRTYRM